MKEYLRSILPRIQNKSRNLNLVELFVDKPWVLVDDESDELLEYEFFRDGRLLVSRGGNASYGRWEQTPSGRLLLEYGEKLLLLHTSFMDEAVMLISKSGSLEPSMAFVNQAKIPDLLYKAYLESLTKQPQIVDEQNIEIPLPQIKEEPQGEKGALEVEQISSPPLSEAFSLSYPNTYDSEGLLIQGYVWSGKTPFQYEKYVGGKKQDEGWYAQAFEGLNGEKFLFLSPGNEDIKKGSELICFDESANVELKNMISVKTWRGEERVYLTGSRVTKTLIGNVKSGEIIAFTFLVLIVVIVLLSVLLF